MVHNIVKKKHDYVLVFYLYTGIFERKINVLLNLIKCLIFYKNYY